jgi:RNase P subunit RPR2
MNPICEHCGELYDGRSYRVTSEEDGIILLDMIVCHSCSIEARRLGLETREYDIRHIAVN